MKTIPQFTRAIFFTLCALGLALPTLAAEQAGRVLASVGDNVIQRGGQAIRAVVGVGVEKGDTLKVGEGSNMQVRFSDESVVALRPNTVLNIDDYVFANKPGQDKSAFNLLKGGLRTITGLIGKGSRENYAVKTETATIGIRGTHYTLVSCSGDCREASGSLAPNGTYGSVTEGSIVTKNQAGEQTFNKSDNFYIPNVASAPKPLLAPPPFLRDKLEGQAKTQGRQLPPGGPGAPPQLPPELAALMGGADLSTLPPPPGGMPTKEQMAAAMQQMEQIYQQLVQQSLSDISKDCGSFLTACTVSAPESPQGTSAMTTVQYPMIPADPTAIPTSGDGGIAMANNGVQVAGKEFTFPSYQVAKRWVVSDTPSTPSGVTQLTGLEIPVFTRSEGGSEASSSRPILPGEAAARSTIATAAGLVWNRYDAVRNGSFDDGTTIKINRSIHVIDGTPESSRPTSGIFTYEWIGGTRPTDNRGNVGTVTDGGQYSVNFGAQTFQTTRDVAWNVGGVSYTLQAPLQSLVGATGVGDIGVTAQCRPSCSVTSASAAGSFYGSGAAGAGVSYATTARLNGQATNLQTTGHVQAYKQAAAPIPAP